MRQVLLLTLFLASPLAAETRQHGNVIFDIPKGWHPSGTREDGTLILRSDLPNDECEYCVIYITPGTQTGGRADTWVAGQARRFIDADDKPEITPLVQPEITNLSGRPAALLGQKVDTDLQVLFAIQLFGRMELIGFEASAYDEADLAEGMKVFERDVAPMVEGARFVSEGAEPLLPAPEPGPLQGLYWGTSTSWMMQLDGTMQMQLDHQFLVFWPDGRFYEGTPPQGLTAFDPVPALDRGDMSWGNYRMDGDRVTLAYASGETSDLSVNGEALVRGEATLYQVEPLADGTKVNGTLSTFFYTGFTPGSGLQGGISAASNLTFHPDGTWARESSGGASASFVDGAGTTTGGMTVGNSDSDKGRYEVKDGLLIRTPDDGSAPEAALIFKSGTDIMIGELPLE
ncbi:MAG: hypothetical protein ACKO2N_21305 [Tabrizicola sp.]